MLTVFPENERLHAPALTVEAWLNQASASDFSNAAAFKGKVTLLDFWDYSCINCLNTLPFIRKWHGQYQHYGLQLVGIHAPEFSFAKDAESVLQAMLQLDVTYPVGLDNRFTTWQAYTNRGWPTQYVVDPNGYLKACNRGEGNAYGLEVLLRNELAALNPDVLSLPFITTPDDDAVPVSCSRLTPELYLGNARGRFGNVKDNKQSSQLMYGSFSKNALKPELVYLGGQWQWEREYLESMPDHELSEFRLTCQAGQISAVIQAETPTKIWYSVDDGIIGWRWVHPANCYPLVSLDQVGTHHLRVWCDTPGVKFYTLLFQP